MKADIGDTKFKDVRKTSTGISKKDMITNQRRKRCFLQLFCNNFKSI